MIFGAHVIVTSTDEKADRAFLGDVLATAPVDAGRGWLLFALPPAEVAVHPGGGDPSCELYLMCDDVEAEVRRIEQMGVACSPIEVAQWGSVSRVRLPGGATVGIYQPTHPTALVRSEPPAEGPGGSSARQS